MNRIYCLLIIIYITIANLSIYPEILPFVSDIQAYEHDGKVLLKWKNPDSNSSAISIYRSDERITFLSDEKKIVTIPESEESYIDSPGFGSFYYSIILDKTEEEILVPYRNTLPYPVFIEEEKTITVKNIKIRTGETAEITWSHDYTGSKEKFVNIYKNTKAIKDLNLLNNSIKTARVNIKDGKYFDKIIPGIEYYYAVIPENKENKLKAGENYTENPISISYGTNYLNSAAFTDFIPLPLLSFDQSPKTGEYFDDPQILKFPFIKNRSQRINRIVNQGKKDNSEIVRLIDKNNAEIESRDTYGLLPDEDIFQSDIFSEQYKRGIENYKKGYYKEALDAFENILNNSIPETLFRRVSYYTAACYFYRGEFYNSYIYTLQAAVVYSKETLQALETLVLHIYKTLER